MQLKKTKTGDKFLVQITGRIDTTTAVDFGTQVNDNLDDVKDLVLDFTGVDYVSSIGLRVILELQKRMNEQGSMVLVNVQEPVMDIFEMTGFAKILKIENA